MAIGDYSHRWRIGTYVRAALKVRAEYGIPPIDFDIGEDCIPIYIPMDGFNPLDMSFFRDFGKRVCRDIGMPCDCELCALRSENPQIAREHELAKHLHSP